ncbi:MAG: group III truncated hemoglobin, partial [Staphylococcus warneri]|nr:group III truncated hemoglobin [Staphylococcus warneri]
LGASPDDASHRRETHEAGQAPTFPSARLAPISSDMNSPAAQTDRHPLAVQHPELDDASIRLLVETFYGRAREDALIGPIFNRAVADWDEHIDRISDFWSSMFLKTGRYNGAPMRPHLALSLQGAHFDRWLQLFEATARELFAPDLADLFIIRARRIADSFEMGIASTRGELMRPRHSV